MHTHTHTHTLSGTYENFTTPTKQSSAIANSLHQYPTHLPHGLVELRGVEVLLEVPLLGVEYAQVDEQRSRQQARHGVGFDHVLGQVTHRRKAGEVREVEQCTKLERE